MTQNEIYSTVWILFINQGSRRLEPSKTVMTTSF